MKWYLLFPHHIRSYGETLKYLESESGIQGSKLIDDFYHQYLKPYYLTSGIEALFNPVQLINFLLTKQPRDLYLMLGKLSRHLITSPKLNAILKEHNLPGCNVFEGVMLKNKETFRNDYFYYHFYKNMWDNVDFKSSKFKFVDTRDFNEIEEIRIDSNEAYNIILNEHGYKSGKIVALKELVIPGVNNYDLFYFFNNNDNKPIISEKLYQRFRKEKILGADMHEVVHFKIHGAD